MQSISNRVIYVAAPYTSDDPQTVEARVREAAAYGAHLFSIGALPYVPTAHGHALWEAGQRERRPIGHDYKPWQRHSRRFLRMADELHVLMLDGWRFSKGIADERAVADAAGIPIYFIRPHAGGLYLAFTLEDLSDA